MSAHDITRFLPTAYRPFAYCVPSKPHLNTAYQKGGGDLKNHYFITLHTTVDVVSPGDAGDLSEVEADVGIIRVPV